MKRTLFHAGVLGWCARGIFEWPEILGGPAPWWLSSMADGITLVLLLVLVVMIFVRPKPAPAPRPHFDVELESYLKRNDFMLITREQAASLKLGVEVHESPYLKPNTAVFMDKDVIEKLTRNWAEKLGEQGMRRTSRVDPLAAHSKPNNAHPRPCPARWNAFGICSCPPKSGEQ